MSQGHHGKMGIANPSTANSGMNASMVRSSTASGRHKWLSRSGASTTTPNAHTRRSVTGHLHPSLSRQNRPHSTRRHSCNNLSLRLVQNIGQVSDSLRATLQIIAALYIHIGKMERKTKLDVSWSFSLVDWNMSSDRNKHRTGITSRFSLVDWNMSSDRRRWPDWRFAPVRPTPAPRRFCLSRKRIPAWFAIF